MKIVAFVIVWFYRAAIVLFLCGVIYQAINYFLQTMALLALFGVIFLIVVAPELYCWALEKLHGKKD